MSQIQNTPTASSTAAVLHNGVRPPWPTEVVSWLLGSPRRGQRLAVLDLGAGTGLGVRTIATLGHDVTAVDPSEDMLSVLQTVRGELPSDIAARIGTAVGSAESIPLANQSVDAIICFQAWHWLHPGRAMAECDRVLTPTGMMAMAWHTWDRSDKWVAALSAIVESDGTPVDQTDSVPGRFAGRGAFERRDFHFNYELSVDQLVRLASSWSFVTQRMDSDAILSKIRCLGEQVKSEDTGLVEFPHVTAAFRLQLPRRFC